MNFRHATTAAILGTAMLAAAGSAASAAGTGQSAQMANAAANAKVSMTQAVQAAEKAAGGHAVDAGLADESGTKGWEVDLAQNDGSVKTVMVDPSTGAVDQNPQMENGSSDKGDAAEGEQSDAGETGEDAN
ncbi:PepSY domain-containing protein [Jiella sp. M17.18]|uniref:PepSY domain-containing protein n=1 Tax=Jiella sp. M17.18 TaxID=3234247 RepID=UPI0034DFFE8F